MRGSFGVHVRPESVFMFSRISKGYYAGEAGMYRQFIFYSSLKVIVELKNATGQVIYWTIKK